MTDPHVGLDELRARAEIDDVLARFCFCLDEYRIAEAVAVFAEDCVTDYGPGAGGPIRGRAALQARVEASQARFVRTHHQLGQTVYRVEGARANAVTYAYAWHEYPDGRQDTLWLRYDDELVRTGDGWRIAVRRAHISGVDGFPGIAWRFVERLAPSTSGQLEVHPGEEPGVD